MIPAEDRYMRAWVTESPGEPIQLKSVPVPVLSKPDQVLIRVKAASVNPIDVGMARGYGRMLLGTFKRLADRDFAASRFPLITGRDCAGIVEAVGDEVETLAPGDEVIAVVPGLWPGSHAEYVVTQVSCCSLKPSNLDFSEAAALPYVASTAWAALVLTARMNPHSKPPERVLIHGGSGGMGTMSIQMLKAWGVDKVVATCSSDSADMVRRLGAVPIDYRAEDVRELLTAEGPFEVILDCVDNELTRWSDEVMSPWSNSVHVTLISPMMRETDKYGVLLGLASVAVNYFCRSFKSALRGRWFSYAFFRPNQECMLQLTKFAEEGKVVPVVESVMPFEQLPAAYEKVSALHGRGKTVLVW